MPDMYAIQSPKATSEEDNSTLHYTPNIIPCRVHHDGPVESLDRYWLPLKDEKGTCDSIKQRIACNLWPRQINTKHPPQCLDNTETSHFRGRKLRGRRVALPDGYQGVVAVPTDRVLPPTQQPDNDNAHDESEMEEPVKILETQGTFDDIVVWGHETVPAADDTFVKGVEEWLQFAEAVCSRD
ncbi:unnamed protein product [Penicillium salamii]|uniref:Uncharacterized protein n=1 Tax=Penicillium salamii TaxID=1612424 RepID=A0A9W4NYB7_9EURO|nr:unnamed protein product [Penicillium salamii]CAG8156133.1 unnamed protein product [Penicillium salamii]CAG8160397.1 unnamed protein product [Penicillium salamii]CAG8219726.1 unnamed protein product [Penicillium salamii]CAG8289612.1 unnamed protein product [Penicillium salamii]